MFLHGRCSTLLAAAVLMSGCSVRAATTRNIEPSSSRARSTVLDADELMSFSQSGSLFDAVVRLRPGWFESRGTPPLVSVDGSPPSELSTLQSIQVVEAKELRLERPTLTVSHSTLAANGNVIRGDIIMVRTRIAGRR